MKIIRLFGYEIKTHFSIQRFKTIEISIPDDADDAHLRHGYHDGGKAKEWNTSDGEDKVIYWSRSRRELEGANDSMFEVPIPKCKKSVETFCTPFRDMEKRKAGIKPDYSSNRKIVIDLYY